MPAVVLYFADDIQIPDFCIVKACIRRTYPRIPSGQGIDGRNVSSFDFVPLAQIVFYIVLCQLQILENLQLAQTRVVLVQGEKKITGGIVPGAGK